MRLGAKKLVFLLISCSVFSAGFAQNQKASSNGQSQQDATTIPYLLTLHERIVQAANDSVRLRAHQDLLQEMTAAFETTDFWSLDSDSLAQRIGIVSSGEGQNRLAIITWNVEFEDRTNGYGGIVLTRSSDDEQLVTPLTFKAPNSQRNTLDPKNRYSQKNWPGAIYYDILARKQGSRTVYTLLGWDGADGTRNRKIIETLSVNGNRIKFGLPIIDIGRGLVKRHVLEYNDAVSTTLKWREDMEMIVMDHLSPSDPAMAGFTAFYGPDFTYDGFFWHRNHWVLKEDIEVRDTELNAPWNNPRRWRRRSRN